MHLRQRLAGRWVLSIAVLGICGWAAAAGTARAEDEITPPKLKPACFTQPVYPEPERREGIQGTVYLNVEVKADGTVGTVSAKEEIKGHPAFTTAAIAAIRKWCFEPALKDGQAVNLDVVIPVRFALDGKKK